MTLSHEHKELVERLENPWRSDPLSEVLDYHSARSDMNDAAQAIRSLSGEIEEAETILGGALERPEADKDIYGIRTWFAAYKHWLAESRAFLNRRTEK